jgi:hypothetical protein
MEELTSATLIAIDKPVRGEDDDCFSRARVLTSTKEVI